MPLMDAARLARLRTRVLAVAAVVSTEACEQLRAPFGSDPPINRPAPPPTINNPPTPTVPEAEAGAEAGATQQLPPDTLNQPVRPEEEQNLRGISINEPYVPRERHRRR